MAQASTIVLIDNSGSMSGSLPGGGTKSTEAASALRSQLLPAVDSRESVSVWAFGGGCNTQLQLRGQPQKPPMNAASDLARLGGPSGGTPLAISVEHALDTLARQPEPRHLIVVTDGLDTCGGDPCAVVRAEAAGTKVSVHTVGLGMGPQSGEFRTLQCMADASHEGTARTLAPNEPASRLASLIEALGQQISVPKGDLLVTVRDAGGDARPGVSFLATADGGKEEFRGSSGTPLALPEGRYQVQLGGEDLGTVQIRADQESRLEKLSQLGRLIVESKCSENTSFSLLDSSDRLLHSGSLTNSLELDLPPDTYKATMTQFAHVLPKETVVRQNHTSTLVLNPLSELTVDVEGEADPSSWIEVYDDSQTLGEKPVATGPVGQAFPLPLGLYNVKIAGVDEDRYRNHANFPVDGGCRSLSLTLERGPALLVDCSIPEEYEIWNNRGGQPIKAQTGDEVPLQPGLYNLVFTDRRSLQNVKIGGELVHRQCP